MTSEGWTPRYIQIKWLGFKEKDSLASRQKQLITYKKKET